ncbi:hypothetical protein EUGRSUZ_J02643 [Eucalyptus grandis]|uniref:Uncharacterized protein n=2 Tax=Eucalyptus grandis TaxID=71139 RepID=A0ACC3K5H4_EUCGR|nr:hypothetical protein EUGRSUZ_J02643 [Eucalyptus grandis]
MVDRQSLAHPWPANQKRPLWGYKIVGTFYHLVVGSSPSRSWSIYSYIWGHPCMYVTGRNSMGLYYIVA